MDSLKTTPFTKIYDRFLSKVTSDLYLELTQEETYELLQELLVSAVTKFRFPRQNLYDYQLGEIRKTIVPNEFLEDGTPKITAEWIGGYFNCELTSEEQEILSLNMVVGWVTQQLLTIENTRQKFSGLT